MTPDTSGLIPLSAAQAQAAGVERLMSGVTAVTDMAGGALSEMQRVKEAGQWADARDGLYRFEQDVMRELEEVAQTPDLQNRWKQAIKDRLPAYLPQELTANVRERVAQATQSLENAGSIYLNKLSRLGQVDGARRAWERGVQTAVERGDAEQAMRRIEEGKDVFINGADAARLKETAGANVALNRDVQAVRKNPAAAQALLNAADPATDERARKIKAEAQVSYAELRRRYAQRIAECVAEGGMLMDEGLANAERHRLISPEQLRRYTDARDRRQEAMWQGVSVPLDKELLCRMTRMIDEDSGGADDVECLIELATSGLPSADVARLMQRRAVMMQAPQELRRAASRRLNHLFRKGAWGPTTDEYALEQWQSLQGDLLKAFEENPGNAEAAVEAIFKRENRLQDEGWVRFRDLKKSANAKKKEVGE